MEAKRKETAANNGEELLEEEHTSSEVDYYGRNV